MNASDVDVTIKQGDVVGGLFGGGIQTRKCRACEAVDHDVMLASEITDQEPAWCPLPCEGCGSEDVDCRPWIDERTFPEPQDNPA